MGNNRKFYGWALLGVLWVIYLLNMGFPLYGGSVINSYMLQEIQMSRSTYGFGFTLLNFFVGVPAFIVAASVSAIGVRYTFMVGAALILLGGLLMSFLVAQPWHYLVAFGCIIGAGIGFSTIVPITTCITRWFKRYRGRAMGIAMTAAGFGGFIASPLVNRFIAATGDNWRTAWLFIAGIAVVAGIIAYLLVRERPEDMGQVPDGVAEDTSTAKSGLHTTYQWTPEEAYRTASYWLIVLAAFATFYPFFFMTAHWVLHLRGLGLPPATAAWAMGLFTLASIGGRLLGGVLVDYLPARYVFMLGTCSTLVGSYIAIGASQIPLAVAAAVLLGVGFGWTYVTQSTMIANYFGPAAFPKLNGTLLTISHIIAVWSGVIAGKLFDAYQSYTPAFSIHMIICMLAIVAIFFAKPPEKSDA
ncbi:MAG TPA: MFS transporter [Peptococcaceae bacterium]|nr:MFS transporter [Peptococcaceae bacterium]